MSVSKTNDFVSNPGGPESKNRITRLTIMMLWAVKVLFKLVSNANFSYICPSRQFLMEKFNFNPDFSKISKLT